MHSMNHIPIQIGMPCNYHPEGPDQSYDQGFHGPTPHTPRNLRQNEGAEGGGAYSAKRKRTK